MKNNFDSYYNQILDELEILKERINNLTNEGDQGGALNSRWVVSGGHNVPSPI